MGKLCSHILITSHLLLLMKFSVSDFEAILTWSTMEVNLALRCTTSVFSVHVFLSNSTLYNFSFAAYSQG